MFDQPNVRHARTMARLTTGYHPGVPRDLAAQAHGPCPRMCWHSAVAIMGSWLSTLRLQIWTNCRVGMCRFSIDLPRKRCSQNHIDRFICLGLTES